MTPEGLDTNFNPNDPEPLLVEKQAINQKRMEDAAANTLSAEAHKAMDEREKEIDELLEAMKA